MGLASYQRLLRATYKGAFKAPLDTPISAVVSEALTTVWDQAPAEYPVLGGSLPAAYFRDTAELAAVPALVVPYANPDQGNHSPNEHLDLECFRKGIKTSAETILHLADFPHPAAGE